MWRICVYMCVCVHGQAMYPETCHAHADYYVHAVNPTHTKHEIMVCPNSKQIIAYAHARVDARMTSGYVTL
jgi:hypothetical protein